ncbi:MAG: hypothetical protein ACOYOR_06225 [Flavobacterium psychrophilum]
MKALLTVIVILLYSCGVSGDYCSTVPTEYGDCRDGYQQVKLEKGGRCIISQGGDVYANYGHWIETEDGVIISEVNGEFSTYNGTYEWEEHNNAKGPGKVGKALRHVGYAISYLFPL